VAVRSTLVTWALVVVFLLAVRPFLIGEEMLTRWARRLIESQGLKGWGLLLLIVVGALVLTWKRIVDQLWVGLTGRNWIVIVSTASFPVGLTLLTCCGAWVYDHPETHAALWAAVPWIAGSAVILKLGAGVLVARTLLRRGLVATRTVRRFAVIWVVGAAVLFGLICWLVPPEVYSPPVIGCTAMVLVLPLVRLGLAPMALDWNRHR
jgi:hypothetical protein